MIVVYVLAKVVSKSLSSSEEVANPGRSSSFLRSRQKGQFPPTVQQHHHCLRTHKGTMALAGLRSSVEALPGSQEVS